MKVKFLLLFFCLLTYGIGSAAEWTVKAVPNPRTAGAWVSDPDNLIDDANESQLNAILNQAEHDLTSQIAVVALQSTGQIDLKSFATNLFNQWGIGKKQKDNGLLILMVLDQKKVTMETGYGLEGVLPDVVCYRIIQDTMVPYMKEGQIGAGMLAGVNSVLHFLSDPKAAEEIRDQSSNQPAFAQGDFLKKLYLIVVIYLFVSVLTLFLVWRNGSSRLKSVKEKDPYQGYIELNSAGVIFKILAVIFPLTVLPYWLFFSSKVRTLRKKPRVCPECGKSLKLMSEKQEDAYLSVGQQKEETVGSVDYDAWVCMDCGHKTLLSYAKTFTRYQVCPQCRYKTFAQTADRIVTPPTPLSTGQGVHVYTCANCKYESNKYYTIPMIIVLPSGRGGGSGFGGSGGGFGGGSFGGGSSGGGGATGGW